MYYVIGLGNPGEKYKHTRHNVGWYVLDALVTKYGLPATHDSGAVSGYLSEGEIQGVPVATLYPTTYMNHSGVAARKLVPAGAEAQTIVVYDDVDIPFGEIKVAVGGGAAGHNGIKSMTQSLGTSAYIRVRVGIAPAHFWTGKPVRPVGAKLPAFVLKPFTGREQKQLPDVSARAAAAIETIVTRGVTTAMNQHNQSG